MQLSLSTDYGSEAHWRRLIDFATAHSATRVVYWTDATSNPRPGQFFGPYRYPRYPDLLSAPQRAVAERRAERFATAARLAAEAGLDLWVLFQVLDLPDPALARQTHPQLFNAGGEPDLLAPALHDLLRAQLDELIALAPKLRGIEMWNMECAAFVITELSSQSAPIEQIVSVVVDTVHGYTEAHGLGLDHSLHTAGGDRRSRRAIMAAAARHPDMLVSADNVVGDFHLLLPFHADLREAARTNPIGVNFDLNGENFGRNIVPSSSLRQYAEHLEIARGLGAAYVNGRVATAHDIGCPHANVLPSRRRFYPGLAGVTDQTPVPRDLEILCTDTLDAFNAEFFCRRWAEGGVQAEPVVREFLTSEFGPAAAALVPAFMCLEAILAKVFYTDMNYYGSNRMVPKRAHVYILALDLQMTLPAGAPFPPPEARQPALDGTARTAFDGWTTPLGHRAAGAEAMIQEKEEGLRAAEALLAEVRAAAEPLAPGDRAFIVHQFEDLALLARANRLLLEAHVHHFHIERGVVRPPFPDRARLDELLGEIEAFAAGWDARYPAGRYYVAERLRDWIATMSGRSPS